MDVNWTLLESNVTNSSVTLQENFEIDDYQDTTWILTSSFIIFTMQTGFGMLESGCVSIKNEANIMMKNLVDISLGGLTYWMFGYGLSFGEGGYTNGFVGLSDFLVDPPVGDSKMGPIFASFLFQLSFATTATTIVSGAMAERCNFKAYCLFSFLNTVVYCVPAGWVWGTHGFLYKLGAVDIAGSGPVHLIGGSSAFASALMLGPRLGRYAHGTAPLPLGNPVNAVMGTFVLWWGWLAFNSGSTYGISGAKWQYASRAAVMTMMGSFGGGCFGLVFTMIKNKGRADVMDLINSVLGSLVSVTAGCFLYRAWESLVIGMIGGAVVSLTTPLFDKIKVDDPVGASAVHGACGVWGGGWYLLGVQALTVVCLSVWAIVVTTILLWLIDRILPIRMDPYEELLGADLTEHRIRHGQVGVTRAVSALRPYHRSHSIEDVGGIGINTGHRLIVDQIYETNQKNKGKLHPFTNHGFLHDETKIPKAKSNKTFTKTSTKLQSTIDNMMGNRIEVSTVRSSNSTENGTLKNRYGHPSLIPEELKHKKYSELSVLELEELGELNASQDRFRHRFNEDDYKDDFRRANLTWIY